MIKNSAQILEPTLFFNFCHILCILVRQRESQLCIHKFLNFVSNEKKIASTGT